MTTVVTTFSKEGYELYGKRWIDSAIMHWPKDIKFVIYTDFDLTTPAENFEIKNFEKEFPEHVAFKELVLNYFTGTDKSVAVGKNTIKFSYKGFVICKELLNSNDNFLVWLDGDVETISDVSHELLLQILAGEFLACQQEKDNRHVESGVLFFDLSNPLSLDFTKDLCDYYFQSKLFQVKKPYDGYIIARILKNKKYTYRDLNREFQFNDKKSRKEDTFLHPLLKKHFVHWIGTVKV